MNKYFTDEADRYITELVLKYNRLSDGDDEKLRLENIIVERTSILFYLIPLRACFIAEEDLSGFLLDIMKDIGRYIASYSVCSASYIAYLTQICRFRCFRYKRQKEKSEMTEKAMIYSAIPLYDRPLAPCSAEAEQNDRRPWEYEGYDLRAMVDAMIETSDGQCGSCSEAERILGDALTDKICRRRFMEYLLYLPQSENSAFIAGVSRVLRIDGTAISHFFYLRHLYLNTNEEEIRRLENITGRYWKLIARFRLSLEYETDTEKRRILSSSLDRTTALFHGRLAELRRCRRGLSQSQIAELMGLQRTSIAYDLCRMRQLLHSIIAEHGNQ